ncbi:MAG: multiple sugar transport system substrate-binding protein [Gaiellales bacterium]|jgi:multiple sugar transport system substrate-binding protein|nr:transporter substrate-binding protein [Glaciihabitans sp.]MDX6494035.1 multiple sugar transport system substrate-binding protein [Gaiellales bacterium]
MRKRAPRTALALGAGLLTTALLLTGCSPSGTSGTTGATTVSQAEIDKAMKTPTTLTFWTWVPNIQNEVDLFEKAYPAIKVKVENVGQGLPHYTKIRTALKAGTGAPDVAQIEYQYLSSFNVTKSLLDLAPYGAAKLQGDYVPWVWNQVISGKQVLAIPQDSGPMGNLYRTDILKKAGVTAAPATWDDYATAAAAVKSKTGSYMSNLAPNDAGQLMGLLWQAGVKPFGYDGKQGVTVAVNSAKSKAVMTYWQKLIQAGQVSVDPDFTDQWYQGLAKGKYAGWLTAAWGPIFLQGTATKTAGLWAAAPLPQYTGAAPASGNWGGSSDAVLATSKNKIAAYEFAKWLNSDKESTLQFATKQFLWPTANSVAADPSFVNQKAPFYGGQTVNKTFAEISNTVDTKFQWLPYMDYAYSSFNDTLGKAIADKGDLSAGLDAWQKALVDYGTQQGFTVNK